MAAALMLAFALPAPVLAQTTQAETQLTARVMVRTSVGRANTFNWLQKTNRAGTQPIRIVRQLGNGSYICSPAGFGRKSRCYSN